MERRISHVLLPLILSVFIPLALAAGDNRTQGDESLREEPRARMADPNELNDAESGVKRASEVYRDLIKDAKVPQSVLSSAKCIAVFPEIVSAAVAVGGLHGDGVAFCRNAAGKWGSPVFLDLTGATVGIQAGAKSTDAVVFMSSEKARKGIEEGSFTLSGDLSAVAGSFDKHYSMPRDGIVSYTKTGGVFAGASLAGVNISRDEDEQRAFYGTSDKSSVFEGKIPPQVAKSVNELRGMLPA